jgi:hypothetical protein
VGGVEDLTLPRLPGMHRGRARFGSTFLSPSSTAALLNVDRTAMVWNSATGRRCESWPLAASAGSASDREADQCSDENQEDDHE